MNAVKEAIQALSAEEWQELYQWALLEERKRREREAIKDDLINEILGRKDEPEEEAPVDDAPVEEEPVAEAEEVPGDDPA